MPRPTPPVPGAAARRGAALALLAALASLAPARTHAQSIAARCAARADAGAPCTVLRLDLAAADDAPWSLAALAATLGAGWTFGDGARADFTGEDAFSFGTPFTGTAAIAGRSLAIDFLESPGFTFELAPGGRGWLEVAVTGSGALPTVTVLARDPDGGEVRRDDLVIAELPTTTTPEPASLALVAMGALGVAALARRARRSA